MKTHFFCSYEYDGGRGYVTTEIGHPFFIRPIFPWRNIRKKIMEDVGKKHISLVTFFKISEEQYEEFYLANREEPKGTHWDNI
jgi:protein-tyrosine phosphatase